MHIRKTVEKDIERVLEIFDAAKKFMRQNGNMNQWVNGYPSKEDVMLDINNDRSYVVEDENGELVATFCYFVGVDPTYNEIYNGSWLNDKPYGVVHRIAVESQTKGTGSFCVNWCFEQCGNLKIDTHEDNFPMQNMLKKNGFTQCGIIYLESGDERVAFQKSK
ncbi:MAG: GNAT family N-acetyltransferase [Anaerofustis stercorihominis]|nr:GNAT family N-acetyltransferase [Anaerofustis stercorihominis]